MNKELYRDLIDDSANRAGVYNLLSGLYLLELTKDQTEKFAEQNLDAMQGIDETVDAGLAEISRYFRISVGKDIRQELATDYAHTILGVTADERQMAMPYESLFVGSGTQLMEESRDDVYRLMCAEHLGTPEGLDIPEDHLGLMFAFMVHLCTAYSEALQAGEATEAIRLANVQKELIENHLENWIDAYCDILEEVARTGFYRGLGKVTRGWIHAEARQIANVILDTEDIQPITD